MKKNKSSKSIPKKGKEEVKVEIENEVKNEVKEDTVNDEVKESVKEKEQGDKEQNLPEDGQLPSLESGSEIAVIDLSNAYILDTDSLLLQITESLLNSNEEEFTAIERKIKSKKELEQIILQNGKMLFGRDTILIDTRVDVSGFYIPDAILFDFKDQRKPKCYLIETMLSKQTFYGYLFKRIAVLLAQLNNKDTRCPFIELICKMVNKNYHFKKKLKALIGEEDVLEFVKRALVSKPPILLITDDTIQELPETMQVFYDTWGKLVKPMVMRTFSINRETMCSLSPVFADIDKGKDKGKVLKSTEEDHLKDASDAIRDSYSMIKSELLKEDKEIEFNPKQYYVSIRKNKNVAFIHIGRKKISLVVMNPEDETKKDILHHEIKTLTEKVQQFWNGSSCTVVIENTDNLEEVINLLKKLVAKS